MDFLQLDVFTDRAYSGNPLAVFPDAGGISTEQMQSIAREMNLSETSFVTGAHGDGYEVRIFTPATELEFAGHPTIGTTWALRHLGRLEGEVVIQRSAAGETTVRKSGDLLWFERSGSAESDREDPAALASALGIEPSDIGFSWDGTVLAPAFADAGLHQLMVPLRDVGVLGRSWPDPGLLAEAGFDGAYCFAPSAPGELRARGYWPGFGVMEDPATGSAVAGLGIYLADRVGAVDVSVLQGVEMGRPCQMGLRAEAGTVSVGGECRLVLEGRLTTLP
jgi:trans-2,3-dihydro-3-hydroxyanthranilate isomerase